VLTALGGVEYEAVLAAIGLIEWNSVTNCATDPPTPVALSTQEWIAALYGNPLLPGYESGQQKLGVLVQWALWWLNCQCVTGPQPNPPAVPAMPTGVGVPLGNGMGYCSVQQWTGTPVAQPYGTQIETDLTPYFFSNLQPPVVGHYTNYSDPVLCYPIPNPRPTKARFTLSQVDNTQIQNAMILHGTPTTMGNFGQPLAQTDQPPNYLAYADTGIGTMNWQPTDTHFAVVTQSLASQFGGSGIPQQETITLYLVDGCQQSAGCCPPDPSLAALLQQVMNLLTLVQRHEVPFGYALGSTHSNISGQGTITVPEGLVGLRVHVDTFPNWYSQQTGFPTWYDGLGFLSAGDANGWWWTEELHRNPWLWFPETMASFTQVGYSLEPGEVLSITELEALA